VETVIAEEYTLYISEDNCSVYAENIDTSAILQNGSSIYHGELLFVSAVANAGYIMSGLTVNGSSIPSGSPHIVTGDVYISASAVKRADAPVITVQPSPGAAPLVFGYELSCEASVQDGGELSYRWYSADTYNLIGEGSSITLKSSDVATKSVYCIVTNTLNGTTASTQSATVEVRFYNESPTPLYQVAVHKNADSSYTFSINATVSYGSVTKITAFLLNPEMGEYEETESVFGSSMQFTARSSPSMYFNITTTAMPYADKVTKTTAYSWSDAT
jgi:hypothetical protein